MQAEINMRGHRVLPKIVEIVHELGARVAGEGIENQMQHELAVGAGGDLVLGFFY